MSEFSLTVNEKGALENLEIIIEQGLNTFVDVGESLMTIRDERLYREQHKTLN